MRLDLPALGWLPDRIFEGGAAVARALRPLRCLNEHLSWLADENGGGGHRHTPPQTPERSPPSHRHQAKQLG